MSYPVSVMIVLALSAGAGWAATRVKWTFPAWDEKALVQRISLFIFLLYLGILYYKLEALQMGTWDFGIYDSMLHNAATGKGLMLDFRGPFDHFSPLFMLFAPLYMIWDHPFWLLLIQSAAMAAAAPLLYATAKHYFPRGRVPLLLTCMYFLNPYYSRLTLYDFHIECFFPLFLAAAFYYYSRKRLLPFMLFLLLAPMLKEDFVIPLGAAGLWMLTQKRLRWQGALAIAGALFWTLFVLKIYYPYILRVDYWHYGRYVLWGGSIGGTVNNILMMAGQVLSGDGLLVMISLLLPFLFLPLFNWKMFLFFWLPTVGVHLVSVNPNQKYLLCHYAAALVAVTPIAALWGCRSLRLLVRRRKKLQKETLNRFVWGGTLGCMLVCNVLYADLPLSRYRDYIHGLSGTDGGFLLPVQKKYWDEMKRVLEHAWEFKSIVAELPLTPETVMVCQNEVGLCFYRKARVFDFTEMGMGNEGTRPENADIYVLDSGNFVGKIDVERVNEILQQLISKPEYQLIRYPNGVLIVIRKALLLNQYEVESAAAAGGQQNGL